MQKFDILRITKKKKDMLKELWNGYSNTVLLIWVQYKYHRKGLLLVIYDIAQKSQGKNLYMYKYILH